MVVSKAFVAEILPDGVVPREEELRDNAYDAVRVPYAVMQWDEGLDWDEDGNSYQDSPPEWFLCGAFTNRTEAETFAKGLTGQVEVQAGREFDLYEFTYACVRE